MNSVDSGRTRKAESKKGIASQDQDKASHRTLGVCAQSEGQQGAFCRAKSYIRLSGTRNHPRRGKSLPGSCVGLRAAGLEGSVHGRGK